jgi:hypothetical protein
MSYVIYTALRHIEKTAFSVSGTDISAATSDDSFNSTSTDLTGLFDNEFVEVSGFTDETDNGYFEVNGDSTTNKILQDTVNLVDQSAGNLITMQGRKRELNGQYKLVFGAQRISTPHEVNKVTQTMLSGEIEVLTNYERERYSITTALFTNNERKQYEEFWWSVSRGETFILDPYGDAETEDEQLTVVMTDNKMAIRREGSQYFRLSFNVLVL